MRIAAVMGTLACMVAMSAARAARAEEWPRFRGPGGQGISAEKDPPVKWNASENVAWKVDVPGSGWSSPIVSGDGVYITYTTDNGASCHLLGLDRESGKKVFDVEVFKQTVTRKEGKNSYATPTPISDGKMVYVSFAGGLAGVTIAGKVVWTNTDFPYYSRHGLGVSPILYDGLLIHPQDGSTKAGGAEEYIGWQKPWDKGQVLALAPETGKVKWKSSRGLMTRIAHVTPLVIDVDGRKQLITPAGDYVEAMDPATGTPLWWVKSKGETPVPAVVYGDGLLFTTSGYEAPTIRAIRPGGKDEKGDLTATHIVWEDTKLVPMMSSFLFVDHLLFGVKENGIAFCREPRDGAIVWQQRLDGAYCASPVHAAGKIYLLSESGKMTVIEAARQFKLVAENPIGEFCQASPAFSNGQIFLRSDKHLFCIGSVKAK